MLRKTSALVAAVVAVLTASLLGVPTAAVAETTYQPAGRDRVEVGLNQGWRFQLGDASGAEQPGFDDTGWQRVDLPHTWNARDGEDGGSYYRGAGWYRRELTVPGSFVGRRLFLQFDGANLVTDAWLNGRPVGHHAGGYAAFRFDITGLVAPGRRAVLAVRVNNAVDPNVLPLQGDFTVFGGLHRGLRLLVTDAIHVDALDYGGPGIFVRQSVSATRADLAITARVTNDTGTGRAVRVRALVTDERNRVVAEVSRIVVLPAGAMVAVTQAATVSRPRLWNGTADPYLYRVHVEVAGDTVSVPLGIRTVAMDPDRGFMLNGRPLELHGVNLHSMRPGKGSAISDADVDADLALIEELGANAVRLAHYQHPQRVYDVADRDGLLLWTEIPLLGSLTATDEFFANARQQVLELIRQNQQHPSVMLWGAGNELYTNSADANRLLGDVAATIAAEDPERPSSYAFCCFNEADPLAEHTVTIGHNLYFGWYYGVPSDMGAWADRIHASFPNRRFAVSEYGAGASVVHHQNPAVNPDPPGEFHPEEWQAVYHEGNWRALRDRSFVWGKFIWDMFDFASDGRDEGDRPGLNDKGLMTADRKIRKDAFYWYQANWSAAPVVHITSTRDTPRFAATTDVKIYTNTPVVELSVNGVSLGRRSPDDHIAAWTGVTLRPGANTIVAAHGRTVDRATWWLDSSTGATEVAVDAGGSDDHNASDGATAVIHGPIAGAGDDAAYRTARTGTFAYRLPVANGTYRVTLKFASADRPGADIFNVNAERQRMIISLDVAAAAGRNTALDKTFTTQVTDGVLDLEFVPQVGQAMVSGIVATFGQAGQ
jgi:beta-galactosidase